MQELRLRLNLSLLLSLCLCSYVSAQQGNRLASMKLLTPEVGWAASSTQLFRTTDNGAHWKDITPVIAGEIASVFFLDTQKGWVLVTRTSRLTGEIEGFDLAATVDGGTKWTKIPVRMPNLSPDVHIAGDARVDFTDAQHGWINVGGAGSAAFNAGFLIATSDGGKTWSDIGSAAFGNGGRGPILFTSPSDGWFTNGLELWVTHDGAKSWQKISLVAPPQIKTTNVAYGLPSISGDRMFLPVTYSSNYFPEADAQSAVVLFSSGDSGKTWTVDRLLQNLVETSAGEIIPTAMAGSSWIVIAKPRAGGSKIEAPARDGKVRTLAEIDSGVSELSFANDVVGWAISGKGELLSTSDGGSSWIQITPGSTEKRPPGLQRKRRTASKLS